MPEEGLTKVEEIYQDRSSRVRELKKEGKKILPYFCCYVPLEILTAANLIPYRILGDVREPITLANAYLEDITCPYVRSCFDIALKGKYDFWDGFISCHSCDNVTKVYDIWRLHLHPTYSHFVNVPHTRTEAASQFFEAELSTFKRSIERFAGQEIATESLNRAVELHNQNRALMRELYDLRKPDPPLISGSEMTKVIVAAMSLPVEEGNETIRKVIKEIKERGNKPEKRARILISGPELDDPAFIELVEDSGANVVMDDLCIGTRSYWYDVEINGDPLHNLADRYLKVNCPRFFDAKTGTHQEDLENRFGYIRDFARDYNVDGVILYTVRFCDIFGFGIPDMREFLEGAGFPVLCIEDEYTMASMARLKTRVQAFLEMIGQT